MLIDSELETHGSDALLHTLELGGNCYPQCLHLLRFYVDLQLAGEVQHVRHNHRNALESTLLFDSRFVRDVVL